MTNYPRLRFTFRCDLARVINLICIVLYCINNLQIAFSRPKRDGYGTHLRVATHSLRSHKLDYKRALLCKSGDDGTNTLGDHLSNQWRTVFLTARPINYCRLPRFRSCVCLPEKSISFGAIERIWWILLVYSGSQRRQVKAPSISHRYSFNIRKNMTSS